MLSNELLGTLLGDAWLSKRPTHLRFSIEHAPNQLDYLTHKSDLLKQFGNMCLYKRKTRDIFRTEATLLNQNEIYEVLYPNSKKSMINILNLTTNPLIALAYWLMDDGCIHASTKNSNKKSPRLLIATCSETEETLKSVISWFETNLQVSPYISIQRNHKRKKEWKLLKFQVSDTMMLWHQLRDLILPLPSMSHKFRLLENEYQLIVSEYNISKSDEQAETLLENICRTYAKRKRKK